MSFKLVTAVFSYCSSKLWHTHTFMQNCTYTPLPTHTTLSVRPLHPFTDRFPLSYSSGNHKSSNVWPQHSFQAKIRSGRRIIFLLALSSVKTEYLVSADNINSNAEPRSTSGTCRSRSYVLERTRNQWEARMGRILKYLLCRELILHDMFHYLAQREGNNCEAFQTFPNLIQVFSWTSCGFLALSHICTGSQRDTPLVNDYFYRQ